MMKTGRSPRFLGFAAGKVMLNRCLMGERSLKAGDHVLICSFGRAARL